MEAKIKTQLENMGFIRATDDPYDVAPIQNAFWVPMEFHANYVTPSLVIVFGVWRSVESWRQEKQAIKNVPIKYAEPKGCELIQAAYGADLVGGQLGYNFVEILSKTMPEFKDIVPLGVLVQREKQNTPTT